jgi:type VI secretion system secreted protein VgrG
MARVFELSTPLPPDMPLLFRALRGREELARLSLLEIWALSTRSDIPPGGLLGKSVTVAVERGGGGYRYLNGYVTAFGQEAMVGRYYQYRLTVHPWLWFLTRTADCRIFQDKTVPQIVKEIFAEHPVAAFEDALNGQYIPREYCVQYRETDFNFVSRLLEAEGICYYFEHTDGRHVLRLVDSPSEHRVLEGKPTIRFYAPGQPVRAEEEFIHAWASAHRIQPGVVAVDAHDFTKPNVDLAVKAQVIQKHAHAEYEVFDWPGEYREVNSGERLARVRADELHAEFERAEAECNVREIAVGRLFTLTSAPRPEQEGEQQLIVSAEYDLRDNSYETSAEEPTTYRCAFTTIPSRQQFRPSRLTPSPLIQGPQTAVVVGPGGEEIWCDKYGRVKVQFRWDRYGKADENSSCWLRVAQNLAGRRWGMVFIPRIGQEVVVAFEEGDPDHPFVIGALYNGQDMPPYPLADHKTRTVLFKSNSTLGGNGFNEIRVEDRKGQEQVFIHAERNADIRIKKDRFETIGEESHLIMGKDHLVEVKGDRHDHVIGDENKKVDGIVSLEAGMDIQEKAGMKHALNAGMEIHLKAGLNVVIESGTTLTLKVGGNFININPAGVFISGTMVMLNSGGAPGSGAGSSPQAPTAPTEADRAQPGERSEPPAPGRPPKPTAYSPAAQVLRQAAGPGTPFCETG